MLYNTQWWMSRYLYFYSEKTEFAFDNSHVWFKKYIDHWFRIAHQKALARITKAVEIDQVSYPKTITNGIYLLKICVNMVCFNKLDAIESCLLFYSCTNEIQKYLYKINNSGFFFPGDGCRFQCKVFYFSSGCDVLFLSGRN